MEDPSVLRYFGGRVPQASEESLILSRLLMFDANLYGGWEEEAEGRRKREIV